MPKKYKYFAILIIVIFVTFVYLMYQLRQSEETFPPTVLPHSDSSFSIEQPINAPPLPLQPEEPSVSTFPSLALPSLEELRAETTDWQIYENKEYKIKFKHPGWYYEDVNSSPYGIPGGPQLTDYNAPEIFGTAKIFAEPVMGVSIGIFYSTDLSKIPTKKSIANEYKQKKYKEIKTFSLNGFEGTIGISEDKNYRQQMGISFRKLDNYVYYIQWGLYEEYEYSKADYSNITYQNQFFPFLASFEISE